MRIIAFTVIAAVFSLANGSPAIATDSGTVVMVRHAEKAKDDPRDPTLSAAGVQRAQALVDALRDSLPVAVFASPYRRTQLTAAPIAALAGVEVTVIPIAGDANQYALDVAAAISKVEQAGMVLVVGHSNTVPPLIAAMGGKQPSISEDDYDNLFIISRSAGNQVDLIHARYGLSD